MRKYSHSKNSRKNKTKHPDYQLVQYCSENGDFEPQPHLLPSPAAGQFAELDLHELTPGMAASSAH